MSKWYEYYLKQVEEIRLTNPGAIIMCKEKYWRFDISFSNVFPLAWHRLETLELESEHRCMRCAKLRKQYETWYGWWMRHYCLPCYILTAIQNYWHRLMWSGISLNQKINSLCETKKQKKNS